jgi:hypothetical protein
LDSGWAAAVLRRAYPLGGEYAANQVQLGTVQWPRLSQLLRDPLIDAGDLGW